MMKVQKQKTKRLRRVRRVSARFMNAHEFADLIGVNVATIKRRSRDRDIDGWPTSIRIGGNILLYERTEVERFLQKARVEHSKLESQSAAQPAEVSK